MLWESTKKCYMVNFKLKSINILLATYFLSKFLVFLKPVYLPCEHPPIGGKSASIGFSVGKVVVSRFGPTKKC